jgi:transposase
MLWISAEAVDVPVAFLGKDLSLSGIPHGIKQLARFARKLCRHADGILDCFDSPITTVKIAGIDNRIKVIKRVAYGYRDIDYFKLKIYNIHTARCALF